MIDAPDRDLFRVTIENEDACNTSSNTASCTMRLEDAAVALGSALLGLETSMDVLVLLAGATAYVIEHSTALEKITNDDQKAEVDIWHRAAQEFEQIAFEVKKAKEKANEERVLNMRVRLIEKGEKK